MFFASTHPSRPRHQSLTFPSLRFPRSSFSSTVAYRSFSAPIQYDRCPSLKNRSRPPAHRPTLEGTHVPPTVGRPGRLGPSTLYPYPTSPVIRSQVPPRCLDGGRSGVSDEGLGERRPEGRDGCGGEVVSSSAGRSLRTKGHAREHGTQSWRPTSGLRTTSLPPDGRFVGRVGPSILTPRAPRTSGQ